ncbi:hypothetical protein QWA68_006572 [Fusarium oxysporum]|nr:hypothetical protein QWA68_006572 [Fusarium oxysporum]
MGRSEAWRPPKGVRPARWIQHQHSPQQTLAQSVWAQCGVTVGQENVPRTHSVAQRSTLWVIEEHVGSCEVRSWIVGPGLFPHGWNRPSKRRWSPFAKTRTDADRLWPLES